jgi:hypothetical protein
VSIPWFAPPIDCSTNNNTNDCKDIEIPFDVSALLKPGVTIFEELANAALAANIWTRTLGLTISLESTAKGKIRTCCKGKDKNGLQIEGELSGKGTVNVGKDFKGKFESGGIPFSDGTLNGELKLDSDISFGTTIKPNVEIKGTVTAGCGEDPDSELSINFGIPIKSGLFGTSKAKVSVQGVQVREDTAAAINGGAQGGIDFTFKWSKKNGARFCYKQDGLYLLAEVKAFNQTYSAFTPTNKFYLINPISEVCDPPGAPAAFARLDNSMEEIWQQFRSQATRQLALASVKTSAAVAAAAQSGGEGICAQVRLRLDQDLILTRNAFKANLELDNNDPAASLQNISIQVNILDANGQVVNDKFEVRTNTLEAITAVDGTGMLAPSSVGNASFILVPTHDAAPESPTLYSVGGFLMYDQGEQHLVIPFQPVPITVYPDPRLNVKYFHQRDVLGDDPFTPLIEPSVPYSLAVLVQNAGHGSAQNVRITSAQPRIVDNDKGLLIDFKIIATEVAGRNPTPSLTLDFGDIDPGQLVIGRWLFTSTLQGLFVDYNASIEHTAGPLESKTSLIDDVSIHEMIRIVDASGQFEDGKPDFLVNDLPDPADFPDTLYLSDGSTNTVQTVSEAEFIGQLSPGNLTVQMHAASQIGWTYLHVPDPGHGAYELRGIKRSDGTIISVGTNAWTTVRTFIGNSKKPVLENILHLLDYNTSGDYTLTYEVIAPIENVRPTSRVVNLPPNSYQEIPISWAGSDASGIAFYDIFVSEDNGPFTLWQSEIDVTGAVYHGANNRHYAFYSIATDNAGNREEIPVVPDAETSVTLLNHAPSIDSIPDQRVAAGATFLFNPVARDPDNDSLDFSLIENTPAGVQIDPTTGLITWTTGPALSGTNKVTVQVLDNGIPRLGSVRSFKVIISGSNTPAVLSPIADATIDEGKVLTINASAFDTDFPAQSLIFVLAAGAPAGAVLSANGVFTWRPSDIQGGRSYPISLFVADNGTPSLSTTQKFNVFVRDSRTDFKLGVGSTNLFLGATSFVPVILNSTVDLTNLVFNLELPSERLTDFGLQPLAPQVGAVAIFEVASNLFEIHISSRKGSILPGSIPLLDLSFTSVSNLNSASILVQPGTAIGTLDGGIPLDNGSVQSSRIILVGDEPVLTADSGVPPSFILYGKPDHRYTIDYSSNLALGNWIHLQDVTLTGEFTKLNALPVPLTSKTFIRARENP